MSYDLYLFELSPSDDAEASLSRFDELDSGIREDGGGSMNRKLEIAQVLIEADPRFEVFEKDFEAIAEFEGISIEEAQSRYSWVELNGPVDERMAQIIIEVNHIVIHWYSGTSDVEMDMYLRLLCRETGYAVFDPQTSSIQWYSDEAGWHA